MAYVGSVPDAGEVLIVSGPPGSGKTTVSAALAAEAAMGVHIESDWFFAAIRCGFVAPHLPGAHSQNTAVIDVATDAAAGFAAAGYAVVWDGVVGPWFLDRVARRLAARGIGLRYLVLRPDRETALDRVRRRDGTTETSGAEVMFDQFGDLGDLEVHVIESGAGEHDVLQRCKRALLGDGLIIERDRWVDDRWPVSVKGVLGWGDRFVVLHNRRGEWELPGGRLDLTDADPVTTLRREMLEELGLEVEVGPLVDTWVYEVEGKRVLILTYRCQAPQPSELSHSDEHTEVGLLSLAELESAPIPAGYLASIDRARPASLRRARARRRPRWRRM